MWAITENLGDWSDVRRRLSDELHRRTGTPAAVAGDTAFDPAPVPESPGFRTVRRRIARRHSSGLGEMENPPLFPPEQANFSWSSVEDIPLVRHAALNDQDTAPAGLRTLASRAKGGALGVCCAAASTLSRLVWTRRSQSKSALRCRTCSSASSPANLASCARCRISGARLPCWRRARTLRCVWLVGCADRLCARIAARVPDLRRRESARSCGRRRQDNLDGDCAGAHERSVACRRVREKRGTCSRLRRRQGAIPFTCCIAFSSGSSWPTQPKHEAGDDAVDQGFPVLARSVERTREFLPRKRHAVGRTEPHAERSRRPSMALPPAD